MAAALVPVAGSSPPSLQEVDVPAGPSTYAPHAITARDRAALEGVKNFFFYGKVVDRLRKAVVGAKVQFWQTDILGVYDHSGMSGEIDPQFQYYGTATAGTDGSFVIKTQRPGIYSIRPITHFHYKVFYGGVEKLTSQFYFSDENPAYPQSQVLTVQNVVDFDGTTASKTTKTIVIDMGTGGSTPLTPRDQEGPFYPEVNFTAYDNDLTVPMSCTEEAKQELVTKAAATCEGVGNLPIETSTCDLQTCISKCRNNGACLGFKSSSVGTIKKCELYSSRPTQVRTSNKKVSCGRAMGACT